MCSSEERHPRVGIPFRYNLKCMTRLISRRMLAGSEKQLPALGSLTLNFGIIDEVLVEDIIMLVGIIGPDLGGREPRLQKVRFSDKVGTLRILVRVLADRFGVDVQRIL